MALDQEIEIAINAVEDNLSHTKSQIDGIILSGRNNYSFSSMASGKRYNGAINSSDMDRSIESLKRMNWANSNSYSGGISSSSVHLT